MTEAELTRSIVKELNKLPYCFAVKIHGGPHQARGLPDITGCYRRRFFGLEVKLPGKEKNLTPIQAAKLNKIKAAGGIAAAIVCLDDALEALNVQRN